LSYNKDGASSHIEQKGPDFGATATIGDWDIPMFTHPAQYPDKNQQLYLTFFRAL
jgi:hypothetical protein